MLRGVRAGIAVALGVIALAGTACAQPLLPAPGEAVQGRLTLLGRSVALPPGEWKVAATGFGSAPARDGAEMPVGGVLLTRADAANGVFLVVHANALPARAGWGQPEACARGDALFRSAAEPRDGHNGCAFVLPLRGRQTRTGLGVLARSPQAAALPVWTLMAGFRVSDRRDFVDIRFGVSPLQPSPAGWFGEDAATDPAYRGLVDRLAAWAQRARAITAEGMAGPPGVAVALPEPALTARKELIDAPGEEISTERLAIYKTATYRAMSSVQAFLTASWFTGSAVTGGWVTLWSSMTHSALYLANELAWEWPGQPGLAPLLPGRPVAPAGPMASLRPAAYASPAAAVAGPAATTPFALYGKQVPLPAGAWTELARLDDDGIGAVVLAHIENGALRGLAIVRANRLPTESIFGAPRDCGRSDLYFATIRFDTPLDGACAYAKPVALDGSGLGDPLWREASLRLAGTGVALPSMLLSTGTRVRTRAHFLDLRYYFPAPVAASMSPARLDGERALRGAVNSLRAWSDLLQEPAELGLRGRLDAADAALPWPADDLVPARLIQELEPLRRLHQAGAIGTTEFGRRAAALDPPPPGEVQNWSLWTRSAVKVLTYRVVSFADTTTVYWLVTGNASQALAYAGIAAVAKPALNYLNEVGWASSGYGRPKAPLLPAGFAEIGRDRF